MKKVQRQLWKYSSIT